MNNNIQTQGFKMLEWVLYAAMILTCFLLFNQSDLNHTVRSSYAFLNGHISDFYEYNKTAMGGVNYLPIIYIIFAAWFYPLHMAHLTSFLNEEYLYLSPLEIIWGKILLGIIFFACAWLVFKCSEVIGGGDDAAYYKRLYITSPLAIFSVFIFSQYDVFGSFFTLAAFYLYLKRKFGWSSIIFSLAISCKFFAALIFIPLILLAEKNIINISKYLLLGAFFVALQFIAYAKSQAFIDGILMIPKDKIVLASINHDMLFNAQLYGLFNYIILVLYSYVKKYENEDNFYRDAILLCLASYAILFMSVVWHPQWIVIIVPFWVMSYKYVSNKKLFYVFDLIGMMAFVWICVDQLVSNVDVTMIYNGALSRYFNINPLYMSDIYRVELCRLNLLIFKIYLFSPFIMIYLNRYTADKQNFISEKTGYYTRFFGGLSLFLIPALICIYLPVTFAIRISQDKWLTQLTPHIILNKSDGAIDEVFESKTVRQKFISQKDGLEAISIYFMTYMRHLTSSVIITVYDDNGVIVTKSEVWGRDMINSKYYTIYFNRQLRSKNKIYYIEISSPTATSRLVPAVLKGDGNIDGGILYYNNKPLSGSLCMRLCYAK